MCIFWKYGIYEYRHQIPKLDDEDQKGPEVQVLRGESDSEHNEKPPIEERARKVEKAFRHVDPNPYPVGPNSDTTVKWLSQNATYVQLKGHSHKGTLGSRKEKKGIFKKDPVIQIFTGDRWVYSAWDRTKSYIWNIWKDLEYKKKNGFLWTQQKHRIGKDSKQVPEIPGV